MRVLGSWLLVLEFMITVVRKRMNMLKMQNTRTGFNPKQKFTLDRVMKNTVRTDRLKNSPISHLTSVLNKK